MSNLRFRMLGPVEVERDGQPIAVAGRQQRVVLALLLIHANQPVSADRLVEELWGAPTPARALKRLQLTITRLRKALGRGERALETVAGGYRLTVGPAIWTPRSFERGSGTDGGRSSRASPRAPPRSFERRSGSGAGRRWPTSPTSRSPRP